MEVAYSDTVAGALFGDWSNVFDVARLAVMYIYLGMDVLMAGERTLQTDVLAALQFISWIGLYKYMRVLPNISIQVYFVLTAIKQIWGFAVILLVFTTGFASMWTFKAVQLMDERVGINDGRIGSALDG
jgi:hypothetical protein